MLEAVYRRTGDTPVTVAAVLAEVVRGRRHDAAVFAGIRRERVVVRPVDTAIAVRAGELLGAAQGDLALAVDAFLVAAGALTDGEALVVTCDPGDMGRLAAHTKNVSVVAI